MAALSALLISDGKPGHFHLSEGVLAAAQRLAPALEVTRLEVRRPRWLTPGMLWRLSASALSPAVILGYCYGVDAASLAPASLVVSAGGDTLAANLAASRLLGAANVFYGSLRRYDPERFSLVLTSYERNAGKPRHVKTLKPSKLDPDTLPSVAPIRVEQPPRLAGLLLGGDAGTVRFAPDDWTRLAAFVEAAHAAHGTRWIVSNSPRTPAHVSDALVRLAAPGGPIAELIDIRHAGTGTLERLFSQSEAILCTADSSSMVSEAVWARRPVLALTPAAMTLPADEIEYRGYLEAGGWARSMPIAELTPERVLAALAALHPLQNNPLDELARVLADKLPLATRPRAQ